MSDPDGVGAVRMISDAVPPGSRVGIAVSGGGDSLAALIAAVEAGLDVRAATVDHGLRAESGAEAATVAALCRARGVPHDILHWRWDRQGNLQAEARKGRLAALARWAQDHRLHAVVLGHTQDDVAETFVMRLARQAGVDGLARMRAVFEAHGILFLRPFLDMPRQDLRAFLTRRGLTWIEDPTNRDMEFERARVRAHFATLEPLDLDARKLASVARQMHEVRDTLEWATRKLIDEHVVEKGGALFLSDRLHEAPAELVRRVYSAALRWIGGRDYAPRREDLARFIGKAVAGKAATLHGVRLVPKAQHLLLVRELAALRGLECSTRDLWDSRWRIEGPHGTGLTVRALGPEGLPLCPDWRATGLPREVLLASPAIWARNELCAAPLAGLSEIWRAQATPFCDRAANRPGSD